MRTIAWRLAISRPISVIGAQPLDKIDAPHGLLVIVAYTVVFVVTAIASFGLMVLLYIVAIFVFPKEPLNGPAGTPKEARA